MRTIYISICGSLALEYVDSVFYQLTVLKRDKVSLEALRHDIVMFEEEIDTNLFQKQ